MDKVGKYKQIKTTLRFAVFLVSCLPNGITTTKYFNIKYRASIFYYL